MNYYLYELINKEDVTKSLVEIKNRWMDNKKWKKLYSEFIQAVVNSSKKELDIILSKKYLQIPFYALNSYEKQIVLVDLRGTTLESISVKDIDLTYVCLDNSLIKDVSFEGTDFGYSSFENCKFENCKFQDVNFSPSNLKNATFKNCELKNVNFEGSVISQDAFTDTQII